LSSTMRNNFSKLLLLVFTSFLYAESFEVCEDDAGYRLRRTVDDSLRPCKWVAYKQSRQKRWCNEFSRYRLVKNACPLACNNCCKDDADYKFKLPKSKKTKRCKWVGKTETRKNRWCNRFKKGITVKKACPLSCDNCPSASPSSMPSSVPSTRPSLVPSGNPSTDPSSDPSALPSMLPSLAPSVMPSSKPSDDPSALPSSMPSSVPSTRPSLVPSGNPSTDPSSGPSAFPTGRPSASPSNIPTFLPTTFYEYRVVKDRDTWTNHEANATNWGGHLVSIDSSDESTKLSNLLIAHGAEMHSIWLGGRRDESNTTLWEWSDETVFDYSNWYEGEPSAHLNYRYVVMKKDQTWYNIQNSNEHYAIYKRKNV